MEGNALMFYNNKVAKLQGLENSGQIQAFLDDLQKLYPSIQKLFSNDLDKLEAEADFFKRFAKMKAHVFSNVIPKITFFDIGFNKMKITVNGKTEEFPFHNPVSFMETYLNTNKSHPYYYLMLSFLMLPHNYDIVQLCDKKIS